VHPRRAGEKVGLTVTSVRGEEGERSYSVKAWLTPTRSVSVGRLAFGYVCRLPDLSL